MKGYIDMTYDSSPKSNHSDDDSSEGQLMRLLKGYQAQEEKNHFALRVTKAKRDKARASMLQLINRLLEM
jgi:hypothetical protein